MELRRSTRIDPYDESAYFGLGIAYFNLGLSEDAADALSLAAKLMPENSEIQAQLAVIYRELFREGNGQAQSQMQQRVVSALKLDPENEDALAIQAEIYLAAGWEREAEQVQRRLSLINPEKGRESSKALRIIAIERFIATNQWVEASAEIRALDDPIEARRLTLSYLNSYRSLLPITLVDPRRRERFEKGIYGVAALGFVVGACIGVVVMFAGILLSGSYKWMFAAFGVFLLFPVLLVLLDLNKATEEEKATALQLDATQVFDPRCENSHLIKYADGLDRFRRGQMKDLASIGAIRLKL